MVVLGIELPYYGGAEIELRLAVCKTVVLISFLSLVIRAWTFLPTLTNFSLSIMYNIALNLSSRS